MWLKLFIDVVENVMPKLDQLDLVGGDLTVCDVCIWCLCCTSFLPIISAVSQLVVATKTSSLVVVVTYNIMIV